MGYKPMTTSTTARKRAKAHTTTLVGVRDSKQMTPEEREEAAPKIKALACGMGRGAGFAGGDRFGGDRDGDATGGAAGSGATGAVPGLPADGLPAGAAGARYSADGAGARRWQVPEHRGGVGAGKDDAGCADAGDGVDVPGYGLSRHKGYGTPAHLLALRSMGQSAVHRKSFTIKGERRKPGRRRQ